MSDIDDSGTNLWGRTDESEFSYAVAIPGTNQQVLLRAVQDRDICAGTPAFPSHGHCVWDAALLLADYLQTSCCGAAGTVEGDGRFQYRGKKVVELGAGVGLVGMTLAILGAHVTLTDQDYALPLLAKNVAVNFAAAAVASQSDTIAAVPVVEKCQWGEPFESCGTLTSWTKSVDVVVFSDVLYHESAYLLLMKTLCELVSPATDVFFSFETRNATIEANFMLQLEEKFDVEEISHADNAHAFARFKHPDELFVFHARLKANGKT